MEEHSDILSKLILRKKPTLPENFFQSFAADLAAQLNETASTKPGFEKSEKPSVPAGFFQHFYNNLQAELETQAEFSEWNFVKRKRPEVPVDFESDFRKKLVAEINITASAGQKKSTRGRILKISFWSATAAVAASIVVLMTLKTTQTTPENTVAETQAVVPADDELLEPYVAYLDEESVIDYIIENDIQVGGTETSDEVYDYVDSEIEEAYLDL